MNNIFADGVSAVHVTGNMVRIDLMNLQPGVQAENGGPVFQIEQRLILPLEGFVEAFKIQEQIIGQLINAGVITVNKSEQQSKTE